MNVLLNGCYVNKISDFDRSKMILSNSESFLDCVEEIDIDGVTQYRVPRYYYDVSRMELTDLTTDGQDISVSLLDTFKPRNNEQVKAIDCICENTHGIIAARVGFGKTFVAISSICQVKKKALIIVPTEVLLKQWIKAIEEYTGFTDVGIIKGTKMELDKDICVAMVQTLASRVSNNDTEFMEKMYLANFGIAVYDECHTTASAPEFSNSTKVIFCKRLFGLSATAFRTDGLGNLMQWHIGNILFDITEFINDVIVGFYDVPMELGSYALYINRGSANSFNALYSKYLAKTDDYIDRLATIIDSTLECNRCILVLSCRIDILTKIYEKCKYKSDVSIVHSAIKDKNYKAKAILSTVGCSKTGLDVSHINTLLFATPITSKIGLIQSIGRIADRKELGNRISMVIDITNSKYDKTEFLKSIRVKNYHNLNFKMTTITDDESYKKLLTVVNDRESAM